MCNKISHRGPDGSGIYLDPDKRVGFGHKRLSIIDLTSAGKQPMSNESGNVWVTYNGEIYNFMELKKELEKKGHVFKSRTDTEVIIHSYEEWGERCVDRFAGMFAFGLYDERKKKLFLARDRFGIKPLFYYYDGDIFIFGSEIKAILTHPEVKRDVDLSSIYDYLTYMYIPAPKTIYQDIKKLPPAHVLIFDYRGLHVRRYWDIDFRTKSFDEKEAEDIVRKALAETVKDYLVSDVPVGVFLSGGLDSSTITANVCDATKGGLKTFSIGFDVKAHSETRYARMVADKFGTDHHEGVLSKGVLEKMLPKIINMYDEPCSNSSVIPTYCVSELARKHVKVVLSGDGGDEVFAGYLWYDRWLNLQRFRFPDFLKKYAYSISCLFGGGRLFPRLYNIRHVFLPNDGVTQYGYLMSIFNPEEKREFLSQDFCGNFKGYDDFWYFRKYWRRDLDPISRMQYLDIKTYLHEDCLTKVDRASMAVSLEVRVPLLDHKLAEAVAGFSPYLRYNKGDKKYILKRAMGSVLPEEIVNRGKRGFSAPINKWIDNAMFERVMSKGECMKRGIFNKGVIKNLDRFNGAQRFSMMMLEKWFRLHG
jgi:asparagine synthase (glutamine-hydrolysing)